MSDLDDYIDSLAESHDTEQEEPEEEGQDDLLYSPEPDEELGPQQFRPNDIAGLLGPGGRFERLMPGYRARQGQLDLTAKIDSAMATATNLMAEGPTGTGKSVAALVPAILHAQRNAQRVLYVTASIMLQEQLAKKDLPLLESVMEEPFRYAVMKGVSNYVCLLQLEKSELSFDALNDPEFTAATEWARDTPTGDLGDYDVELSALNRSRITTTSEECVGRKCKRREACHLMKARQRAQKAQVLVVNTHLFFADLVIRRDNDNRGLLPPYGIVILDEAHAVPDIARNFFGTSVGPHNVASAAGRLNRISPLDATLIRQAADRFFPLVDQYRRSTYYKARLTRALPPDIDWEPLHDALRGGGKAALQQAEQVTGDDQERKKLQTLSRTLDRQAGDISQIARKLDPAMVYFLEELPGRDRGTALAYKPLSIAAMLKQHLWLHGAVRSVIAMSATLTAAGSFQLIREELGADAAQTLEVPSPFDWARQAIACLPPGLPEPNHPSFERAAGQAFCAAVQAAGGRTLGLFTSRRMMEAVAQRTRSFVKETGLGYRVLVQGELPRSELIRTFREDVTSVLIGTSSLWEGVDVQGESLSCVVIDRIPFESMSDPIADAYRSQSRDAFKRRDIPLAQVKMRQGIGRLIRTVDDRGCIVFLDARISLSTYGTKFVPGCLPKGVRVHGSADWTTRIREHLARR